MGIHSRPMIVSRIQTSAVITAAVIFIAACNIAALSMFAWWAWLDAVQVEAANQHWYGADKLDRQRYRPGEVAYLSRNFCSSRDVNVTTARRLTSLDGTIGVSVASSIGVIKEGCDLFVYGLAIPVGLPEGWYIYRETLRLDINAVQDQTVVIDSPPLYVMQ
jgi:hypothetical protein